MPTANITFENEETTTSEGLNEKYNSLKQIGNISLSTIGNGKLENISSDLEYVTTNMNKIRNILKNTSFVGNLKETEFQRQDKFQATLNKCYSKYFDITGKLLDLTEKETRAAVSYAEMFEDLDQDIAKKVGDL